jgi:hypothetical protein
MLTRTQCAAWLGVSERWLAEDSRKSKPEVPVFQLGFKTALYHPRSIIAYRQGKAGFSLMMTAASFGLRYYNERNDEHKGS